MRLAVQWVTIGPYHAARLRSLAERAAGGSVVSEVVAVETTQRTDYLFEADASPVPTTTLFTPDEEPDAGQAWARMTETLDTLDPGAVAISSYGTPSAQAALAWCRSRRRVAVMMTDTKGDDKPRPFWKEAPKRALLSAFDAALLAGTPQRRYFESLGMPSERIAVGYDAVDNAWWGARADAARETAAPDLPGLTSDEPFYLTVARFMPRKNIDGLIRAYRAYRAARTGGHPWPLVIVGTGDEDARLRELARGCDGITFAGRQPAEAVAAYYAFAGVYVHPAHADQWGLVVNEAMASGVPVLVSTGAGCAEDLAVPSAGFRFDSADEDALAALLTRVAALPDDERARLGAGARDVIAAWGPERFAEGMIEAVRAGAPYADRPFPPAARALLAALRLGAPLYDRIISDDR